jgi:NHL repeat-containing protein
MEAEGMASRTAQERGIEIARGRRGMNIRRRAVLVIGMAVVLCVSMAAASASAFAAKGVVSFHGGTGVEGGQFAYGPQGGGSLAINQDGAGGVSAGELYAVDPGQNRVQAMMPDGTFVRAFGLDVGGPGIDVCTVAADCAAGTASGSAGGMSKPEGIAVDQATGNVFVGDAGNHRVDVFSATGVFEGAFGWNVMATGGAEELQFCTAAGGCKAGSSGSGAGEFASDEHSGGLAVSPLNGHLLVTSVVNDRVDEFAPTLSAGSVTGVSYVRGYGWGALNGAGEFQVCTVACHAPYSPAPGSPEAAFYEDGPGKLGEARSITVAPNGFIYVGDIRLPKVEVYEPNGTPVGPLVETQGGAGIRGVESVYFDAANETVLTNGSSPGGQKFAVREYALTGEEVESFSLGDFFSAGIAVEEGSGTTYLLGNVSVKGFANFGVIETGAPVPPTVSIEPPSAITGTSATFSGTVNPQGFFGSAQFEYSTDGIHWAALESEELPGDSNEHIVSRTATGLEAHTHYSVRLVATKQLNGGSATAESSFTTGAAVPIPSATTVSEITVSAAVLTGTVNPQNEDANYRFQCVTQAAFEGSAWATAVDLPAGGASVPAAASAIPVSQPFTGLAPTTRYRCRLVAINATGPAVGDEVSFITYAAQGAGLPDGRVYEQATPVEKNGASASGEKLLVKAARGGQAITYFISGGGSTGEGSQDFPTYVAAREGGNWASYGLLPASSYGDRAEVKGWSEDLARDYPLVWSSGSPATFYVRDNATGAMRPIATGLAPYFGAQFAGESADGNEVLFESTTALVTGARNGVPNLYVWNQATGALTLVDVLPTGSPSLTGGFAGSYSWADQNLKAGGAESHQYTQPLNVLSEDGSTAFFTSVNVGQLYARRNLTTPGADTVQVSESHKNNGTGTGGKDPQGAKPAAFMEATPDGHYVYFTSPSELTNDATTGSADQGNDLYRFDVRSKELIDIAPDTADANGAEVQAVLGSSEDGTYVYFIANGVLAAGAIPGNCESGPVTGFNSSPDPCNIYLWHDGSIRYVGPIRASETERSNWLPTTELGGGQPQRTAQVEGNTLIFNSTGNLTGYDNGGFSEIYRYNPADGLICVSCIPSGQSPPLAGASMFGVKVNFGAPIPPNPFLVRNVADGGRRVFFDSDEQLVATDVNHVRDVYEWEASGTGSCAGTTQNGGCIYLISSGTSPEPSYFADASASGDDVFFFTKQQLVGQDTDELQDVYDAKVGGGIAAQNPPPVNPCAGEACRGASPAAPEPAAAGTSQFAGAGNPRAPSACKKGFVRKGGKCVKQKHRKHKRHGKKKHKKQGKHPGKHGRPHGGGKKRQHATGGADR